jgi:glutamate-1-semialdehyde aminotransferase
LQPDFFVIGKPIGGGFPAAAYGMTLAVRDLLKLRGGGSHSGGDSSVDNIDVSGVGGTLTGSHVK